VADLRASLAFSGDLLGGEPTYRFPEDGPVFVAVRLGESSTSTRRSARPARLAPRWCWSPPTSRGASGSPTLADPDGNLVMLTAPRERPAT